MHNTKVVATCIFNKLQAAGLFLALDGTSTRIDPFTSGRKYRKSVHNAIFIRNESLFVVSAAGMSAFQLKHTPRLLRSICPVGYQIRTIRYGKILVMLLYRKDYWSIYEVYNKCIYIHVYHPVWLSPQPDSCFTMPAQNNGKFAGSIHICTYISYFLDFFPPLN